MDELTKTLCSSNYAKENGVLLYNNDVYIREDTPALALLEVRRVLGCAFVPVTLAPEAFDEMLAKIWQQSSGVSQQLVDDMDADIDLMALTEEIPDNEDLLDNDENSPVIRLINAILGEAVKDGASDIHIETFERTLSIRFRVDGVLRPVLQPARKLAPLLVSRIKVMSKLDIAEKRLPQDGRISLRIGRKAIDVRVSTIPSQYGERVVMRLLDKSNLKPDINKLGLIDEELEKLKGLIDRPHGIILVTGPTGSGKSTTLYAILSALNGHERNILTVEDPIEYELEGVGQTQVNPRVDMTFARGLRAILRQDPDVVMIGEIRDGETAQIAVQASLTGHLVMSTLHTNSAAGAITRLRDMGLESFLIGSSLLGVIAQRLVRRLCTHCRTTSPLDANEKALFSFMAAPPDAIYRAVGCEHCRQSGYQGRAGIHEFLVVDSAMRRAIHEDKDEMSLETQLFKHAYSLRENGLLKVIGGVTSLEEVMRVTAERGGMRNGFLRLDGNGCRGENTARDVTGRGAEAGSPVASRAKADARQHHRNPRNGGWRESENRGEALHSGAVDVYPSAFDAGQRRAAAGERAESDLKADGRQKAGGDGGGDPREGGGRPHPVRCLQPVSAHLRQALLHAGDGRGENRSPGRRAGKAGGVQRAAPEDEKQADAGNGLPDNPHRGRHRGHQHPAGGGGAAGDRAVYPHEATAADHHPDADCGQ